MYDLLTGKSPLSAQERKDKEFSPFTDVWAALHPADTWQDKKGATYRCETDVRYEMRDVTYSHTGMLGVDGLPYLNESTIVWIQPRI